MLRLAVRVRRADAEMVLAELLELAPSGVEEVDIDTGTVEYAVYGAPGELPELPDLQAAAGSALIDVSTSEVADDWADRWREFHKPLVLGRRLSVRPPWEPPPGTSLDLVIDPGRAFGTGAHPTTRLCLELLLDLPVNTGGAVGGVGGTESPTPGAIDLGCGSGVLAIAAAKLGWAPVLALDYDQLAVDATVAERRRQRRRRPHRCAALQPDERAGAARAVGARQSARPVAARLERGDGRHCAQLDRRQRAAGIGSSARVAVVRLARIP